MVAKWAHNDRIWSSRPPTGIFGHAEANDDGFDLPIGFELVSTQIDSVFENNVGNLHLKISNVDNKLEIIRSLKINEKIIEPKDYNDFKLLYLNWIKDNWKELIIKK